MLKFNVPTLDEVDETLHEHYEVAPDGGFTLSVDQPAGSGGGSAADTAALRAKVKQFRDNNNAKSKEIEELKAERETYGLLGDPKEAAEKLSRLEALEAKGATSADAQAKLIAESVARRTDGLEAANAKQRRADQTQIADLTRNLDVFKAESNRNRIEKTFIDATNQHSPTIDNGMPDVLRRANEVWQVDESTGEIVAIGRDGEPIFNLHGKDYITPEEWLQSLTKEAPHLFRTSEGGGAKGSNPAGSRRPGGPGVIDENDAAALGDNIDDLISGKVRAQ